jgi:hypothetical protein
MITRTYLDGCRWCNGEGRIPSDKKLDSTAFPYEICPVCEGRKTVLVTETIE